MLRRPRAARAVGARRAARIARKPLVGEGRPGVIAILVPLIMVFVLIRLGRENRDVLHWRYPLVPHVNIGGSKFLRRPGRPARATARAVEPGPVA